MATNEELRRASGKAMEAARRDSGKAMEANRRASGDAMTERRTGRAVTADINALATPPRTRKTLSTVEPRGALPAQRGRGEYTAPSTGGGGGIASPLVEQSYALREYWPNGEYSNDGLLTLPAAKKLVLTDADGAEVIINLASPV